jgi:hypothetical protein
MFITRSVIAEIFSIVGVIRQQCTEFTCREGIRRKLNLLHASA